MRLGVPAVAALAGACWILAAYADARQDPQTPTFRSRALLVPTRRA